MFGPKTKEIQITTKQKNEVKPTLTAKDSVEGEKVCFAWGERDSFHDSKVNEIYKYNKDILTPIVKRKKKKTRKTIILFQMMEQRTSF